MVAERHVDRWNPLFSAWWHETAVSGRHQTLVRTTVSTAFSSSNCFLWFYWVLCSRAFLFWTILSSIGQKKTCTITAKRYLTLLHDHVMPALKERHAFPVVIFMQDGAPPHIATDVKTFVVKSFTEDRVISRVSKIQWPARSLDMNTADFWLRRYLKSRAYRGFPTTLVELKKAIRLTVSAIDSDTLYSVVMGLVTRLTCLLPCGGDNVEHLFL